MSDLATSVEDLLAQFARRGAAITLDGGRLRVRAPKGVLGPEDSALLQHQKAAIIAYLADGQAPDEPFPLTDIQSAYWVGRQSSVLGGVGCHAYREFQLGDVDLPRLEAAWNKVVARHDMLRAVFTEDGMQRVQSFVPHYAFGVTDAQVNGLDARDATRRAMSHHVFDPATWPLFDIRTTRTDGGTFLHMGLDLLIADAASMLQIYREWRHFYDSPDADLPTPQKSFAEFVRTGGPTPAAQARAEAYWTPRLPDLPGPPQLPLAAPPSQIGTPRFTRRTVKLDAARWARLKANSRAADLTPSTLLLSVYADVLASFARQQRFLINMTLFAAPEDYVGVVGDFTSTTLVEVDAHRPTFRNRAQCIQKSLTQALDHNGWSGVRVAREKARLSSGADAAIPVVFTSALGHQTTSGQAGPLDWLGQGTHAITQTPQVWMDHHVIEDSTGLSLSFDFVEQLFPEPLVGGMVAAYDRMLHRLSEPDPSAGWTARLGDHLSPEDHAARVAANDTSGAVPNRLLTDSIVDVEGGRTALVDSAGELCFDELRAAAAAVAQALQAERLPSGAIVGVCAVKGRSQIIGVLGVLMAGYAYLPIAPTLPEKRRNRIIELAGVTHVICNAPMAMQPWPPDVTALNIDTLPPSQASPQSDAKPADLAYVIFTSGSTGDPKGVMIAHRAALNTVDDVNRRFGVTPDDVVLGLSDLGFDLSVYDIFGVMCEGGKLVLPDPERLRDPGHWGALLRRHQVSVWNSVPALAQMLAEAEEHPFPDLRLILLSGDWVPPDLPSRLRKIAPNARVIALGGATEASIWSNYFDTADLSPDAQSVPYGWPLTNQQFHVLNPAMQPCPCGVTGGLYIAGEGLAMSYLGDETLTQSRFFEHPETGQRLYATGDLGRYLPDGAIEFLGREDGQVKVGGHRIELGDVEAALSAHPEVSDVAAFVSGSGTEDRRLMAAVVRASGQGADAAKVAFKLDTQAKPPFDPANPQRILPPPKSPNTTQRKSTRLFDGEPVTEDAIAALLAPLSSESSTLGPKYRYPSAGSTYSVRTWLHAKEGRCGALKGLYLYDAASHALEAVSEDASWSDHAHAPANASMVHSAAFALYLVIEMDEIEPLYGDYARDFAMIETGAMSQRLMEHAAGIDLGLCLAGGMETDALRTPMALGPRRVLAMAIVGGAPAPGTEAAQTSLPEALLAHIATQLPPYMRPDKVFVLDRIPLTDNGKVDRKALAHLGDQQTPAAEETADSVQEERVAEIFAHVFGRQGIGRNDVVFDLGGTSIHVVRIHNLLKERFSTPVDIVDIFRAPSIAGIAALLGKAGPADDAANAGEARGAARRRPARRRPAPGETP